VTGSRTTSAGWLSGGRRATSSLGSPTGKHRPGGRLLLRPVHDLPGAVGQKRRCAPWTPFDGRATATPGDTLATFERNIRRHGVEKRVNVLQGESAAVLPNLPPVFDLIFIDGDHSREAVLADAEKATNLLRPGGVLCFHDFRSPADPGVTKAVEDLIDKGGELINVVGTLACFGLTKQSCLLMRPSVLEGLELELPENETDRRD
jgi:SAM-dependent methyltransferase